MMQETYSSGDFIAAELGYYFATTVDWDYLNQGANISVLSRFPIKEVHVQEDSPFQNVGVKVAISRTQDLYVMSNWYGMDQFPAVFDFHQTRFAESDSIPTLFAGDFNAVPHTDGGDSPASRALLEAGFTDAFRSLYPNVGRVSRAVASKWEENRSALLQRRWAEKHFHESHLDVAPGVSLGPLPDSIELRPGLFHS